MFDTLLMGTVQNVECFEILFRYLRDIPWFLHIGVQEELLFFVFTLSLHYRNKILNELFREELEKRESNGTTKAILN